MRIIVEFNTGEPAFVSTMASSTDPIEGCGSVADNAVFVPFGPCRAVADRELATALASV